MNDQRTIERLRRDLAPYFHERDTTRDLGRGTAFPSSDIPGGLQADDRFFRTDLYLDCVYDGARWLTRDVYPSGGMLQSTITTSGTQALLRANRTDYAPYIVRLVVVARINTTNDGSNNWTMAARGLSANLGTAIVIHSATTAAYTAGTFTALEVASAGLSGTATPSQYQWYDLALTKNGAPGSIDVAATLYYRLIVT